jgi:hypothetical protein
MTPGDFIRKWRGAELTERAAAQSHFIDLCRVLGEPAPTDADPRGEWYAFEKGDPQDRRRRRLGGRVEAPGRRGDPQRVSPPNQGRRPLDFKRPSVDSLIERLGRTTKNGRGIQANRGLVSEHGDLQRRRLQTLPDSLSTLQKKRSDQLDPRPMPRRRCQAFVPRQQRRVKRFRQRDVRRIVGRQVGLQLPDPRQHELVRVAMEWKIGQVAQGHPASVGMTSPVIA